MIDNQLTMDFTSSPSFDRDDFILGACNAMAADWIDRWPDWPGRIKGVVLQGPTASGKSHLASIWQGLSSAKLMHHLSDESLSNLETTPNLIWDHPTPNDDWPDDLLFHHLNTLTEIGGSVLVLSRVPMSSLDWTLADNNSRMRGLVSAAITAPDDDMQEAILYKHADDIGLPLDPDVARYIVNHASRSFLAAKELIRAMNDECLKGKRKLTIPVARSVLDAAGTKFNVT